MAPLIVSVPEPPDAVPLSGVAMETDLIRNVFDGTTTVSGQQATADTVREALTRRPLVHFACHGITDWESPGASRLLLYDHRTSPFSVTTISRLRLEQAVLAYLSACDTSRVVPRLVDEAVHITAAFQIAGYQQVIGTLWPVHDRMARRIAYEFYAVLTSSGRHPPQPDGAARALHKTLLKLRDDYPESPTAWAAYIHVGA